MWDDYRAALEKYDAPDLDWNSLAGLGTWAAYTAFTQIVEGMDGEINHDTFIEAANSRDGARHRRHGRRARPHRGVGRRAGAHFPRIFNRTVFFDVIRTACSPARRRALRHDRRRRRNPLSAGRIPPTATPASERLAPAGGD